MEDHEHPTVPHEEENLKIGGYGGEFQIQFKRAVEPSEIKLITVEMIEAITDGLMRKGAKGIGHIKAYIRGTNGYLRTDSLGSRYGIHIDGSLSKPEDSVRLVINTIALGIKKEEVARVTKESIRSLAQKYDFSTTPLKMD